MNQRIQELAEQATDRYDRLGFEIPLATPDLERFAQLIIQDCHMALGSGNTDAVLIDMGIVTEPEYSVDADGTQRWRVNNQLHRVDGPAVIYANGTQQWWANHQLHRLAGPAVIRADGYQAWYVRNQLHRLDGPAYIGADGTQEWLISDQNITTQVEAWMKDHAITWPWDDPTQMQFLLTWG